jgi:hypothetical protein
MMRTVCRRRAATAGAATLSLVIAGPAAAEDINPDYRELVERYARGERASAVAGLGAFSEAAMARISRAVEADAVGGERGKPAPRPLPLRAAVMLHLDRDEAERPADSGSEQPRQCPGKSADVAAHYAGLLARRDETASFARRFFLALAYRSQWDACLREAEQWARAGLKLFPRDPDLLMAAGSAIEEAAILARGASSVDNTALTERQREAARGAALDRRASYVKARAFYEDAIAAADRPGARVRLGRVLWRLGEGDAARRALERAVQPAVSDPPLLYLAYLFLGRVHEDAGRLDQAVEQYRVALDIDPSAQAAAVALSHALRVAGDAAESRRVLRASLDQAGRRPRRDAFWDYPTGDAGRYDELFADLRREALQ